MQQDTNLVLNKKYITIIYAHCLLLLTACSSTENVRTFTPPASQPDQAVVYIYRPTEMANALYSPGITINDEFKLYAKNGVSSRLSLEPGEYVFEFQPEKKYAELTPVSLSLKPGNMYFIRVATSLKVRSATAYEPYARSFTLTQVDEPQALTEIAECCTGDEKKPSDKTKLKSDDKKPDDGFSVDKTQNPFSH